MRIGLVLLTVAAFPSSVSFARATPETQEASGTGYRAVFNVRQHGAIGDGERLDTKAVIPSNTCLAEQR